MLSGFTEKIRIPWLYVEAGCTCIHPHMERPEEPAREEHGIEPGRAVVGGISFSTSGCHGSQEDFGPAG